MQGFVSVQVTQKKQQIKSCFANNCTKLSLPINTLGSLFYHCHDCH